METEETALESELIKYKVNGSDTNKWGPGLEPGMFCTTQSRYRRLTNWATNLLKQSTRFYKSTIIILFKLFHQPILFYYYVIVRSRGVYHTSNKKYGLQKIVSCSFLHLYVNRIFFVQIHPVLFHSLTWLPNKNSFGLQKKTSLNNRFYWCKVVMNTVFKTRIILSFHK